MTKQYNSYDVRILRCCDNLIMYEKSFSATKRNKGHRTDLITKWTAVHANKFISGEWVISIINNLESINNGTQI